MTDPIKAKIENEALESVRLREAPHDISPSGIYVFILLVAALTIWLTIK